VFTGLELATGAGLACGVEFEARIRPVEQST
jgi:hypothetical protein